MIIVERHGGRQTDQWRVVFQSARGGKEADEAFHYWVKAMRQGGVRIRDDITGEVLREQRAPRLRTRW